MSEKEHIMTMKGPAIETVATATFEAAFVMFPTFAATIEATLRSAPALNARSGSALSVHCSGSGTTSPLWSVRRACTTTMTTRTSTTSGSAALATLATAIVVLG